MPITKSSKEPIGTRKKWPSLTVPAGYLKENGAAISRADYAKLFAIIGVVFGAGDGSTTFNLPDSRGTHDRALDDGRGYDAGRTLGSYQGDGNKSHKHTATQSAHTHSINLIEIIQNSGPAGSGPGYNNDIDTASRTGATNSTAPSITVNLDGQIEATVKNYAYLSIIRAY